jgi:hypothetical protein
LKNWREKKQKKKKRAKKKKKRMDPYVAREVATVQDIVMNLGHLVYLSDGSQFYQLATKPPKKDSAE